MLLKDQPGPDQPLCQALSVSLWQHSFSLSLGAAPHCFKGAKKRDVVGVLDDLLVQFPVFTLCQHLQPISLRFLVDPCNCLAVSIRGEHQPGLGLSSEPRIPAGLCRHCFLTREQLFAGINYTCPCLVS